MQSGTSALARIRARLDWLRENRDSLVIDAHVHPSDREVLPADHAARIEDPNYYHGRPLLGENLIAKMDQAGVDMALCWQNPAVLAYGDDKQENAAALTGANARISRLAEAHPTRVIPAGWTDPKALGVARAIELARRCVGEFAMPVVKMNPAQNAYPIDDPMVLETVDAIVGLGAVPAFHFGSDTEYTPVEGLKVVAARHPDHPVIGVHMGGGGGHFVEAEAIYQAARQAGLDCPNIFYALSAKRDVHIESALITYAAAGEPYMHNIAVASDAPYGDMIWNFGGFRALFAALQDGAGYGDPRLTADPGLFSDDMVQNFMGRNLADLVIAADLRILDLAGQDAA